MPVQNADEFAQVFSAEHRVMRVRFIMYLSVFFFLLMCYATVDLVGMLQTGVEPNGDPISPGEVIALILVAQGAGWAFLIGMHLYGRCYVVRIFQSEERRIYETIGWFHPVRWYVSEDDRVSSAFRRGKIEGHYDARNDITIMAVDAPYFEERVKSRRLPFIIDYAGVQADA